MFVNLLGLRALFRRSALSPWICWFIAALFPYIFGWAHVAYHERQSVRETPKKLSALLLQTAFPIEECLDCPIGDLKNYVLGEWRQIVRNLREHYGKRIDMIVLPEYVVPFGTWSPVYPWSRVKAIFADSWGDEAPLQLPPWRSLGHSIAMESGSSPTPFYCRGSPIFFTPM